MPKIKSHKSKIINEVKVTFRADDPALAAELVADCFYELGVKGVAFEGRDLCEAPAEGWGEEADAGPRTPAVIAYFPVPPDPPFESLHECLAALSARTGIRTRVTCRPVAESDWAHAWKAHFHPQRIDDGVVVKPTWRDYRPGPGETVIEIDPGMAFGTGTHPTTALCIRMIRAHLKPGNAVLDIGTGSGILLIAAAKFGAGRLMGVDSDPVAVDIAAENLRRNGAHPDRFTVINGHLADPAPAGPAGGFDLVVANILTEVILELLPSLPRVLRPGGIFVGSGIIAENRELVMGAMTTPRYGEDAAPWTMVDSAEEDGWAVVVGRLTAPAGSGGRRNRFPSGDAGTGPG